jgi:hypothetical protein
LVTCYIERRKTKSFWLSPASRGAVYLGEKTRELTVYPGEKGEVGLENQPKSAKS